MSVHVYLSVDEDLARLAAEFCKAHRHTVGTTEALDDLCQLLMSVRHPEDGSSPRHDARHG
jgi:hypothetical protein